MKIKIEYIESNIDIIKDDMSQVDLNELIFSVDSLKSNIVEAEQELSKIINSLPEELRV
jgi:hypothetical protein